MLCKELRVVNLNITEDYYDYRGLFRLCSGENCLDVDLMNWESGDKLKQIKTHFKLEEDITEIKEVIMDKIMEASKVESRIVEGKDYQEDAKNKNKERSINALDMA
ncbi:MAG: hypothetical protein MJB12_08955 [Firmicutes bacterium]|nr:hypothetical protein [Bacillota bacterium]